MTAPPLEHPEKQRLIAFGMGKLAPEEATQIEQHLEGCPDCCETILDLQDDTFVGLLRQCELPVVDPDQTNVTLDFASGATAGGLPAVELPRELREHGRYEIQELIGRGGMGDVYKAQHRVMNRPVALKVIRPELVKNSGTVLRFHREVQAAARLHHGNIVAAYDAEQAGDAHYLVMEFVDGVNLDEVIRKSGPLPVEQACDYIRQAAAGLQHAHELGMVHRDIKPHNLMLQASPDASAPGVVKILDFGLAGFATELALEATNEVADGQATLPESVTHQLTQIGAMMGTPDYMAPEQAENAHTADIRADIYSLGCTFYSLLAGRPPFAQRALMEKLKAHAEVEVPPLAEFRGDVPAGVEAVLRKMLAKDPADRYQTPAELLHALRNLAFVAAKPVSLATEKRASAVPRFGILTAAASLAVVAVAAVVFFIQTDYGMVRVEVADKTLMVKLNGRTIEMKDGEIPLSIRAGKPKLVVRRGDFEFETDEFVMRRGETIALKVELLESEIVLLKNGERFGGRSIPGQVAATASSAPSKFSQTLGDLQAIVRKTVTDAGLSVSRMNNTETDNSGGPRHKLTLKVELTGEQERGGKLLAGFRDKFKSHSTPSGAFISSLDAEMQGNVQATNLPYTAGAREGLIRVELEKVGADKREPKIGKWSLVVRLEEWPRTDGTSPQKLAATEIAAATRPLVFDRKFQGHTGSVKSVAFSPDGKFVASASGFPKSDGTIRLWDAKTAKEVRQFKGQSGPTQSLCFSHDGTWLLAGGGDKKLRLWNVATGELLKTLEGHEGSIECVGFSRDDKIAVSGSVATGGTDHTARSWDLATGKEIARFTGHKLHVHGIAVIDETRAISVDRMGVGYLWRIDNGQLLKRLSVASKASNSAYALSLSPDRSQAIIGYQDDAIRLWDLDSGEVVQTFATKNSPVMSVCMTADRRYIIAGGGAIGDTKIAVEVFEVASGKRVAATEPMEGTTWSIALAPDGRHVLSAGGATWNPEEAFVANGDNDLYLWKLPESVQPPGMPPPLTIGMNKEFGLLFQGRLVAPAELSRELRQVLKKHPDRLVTIVLAKNQWTVAGHVTQLEQIARTAGAKHITRPAWSEIRIVLSVVNSSVQVLDINGPGYTATGFFQSHLPNVREVVAKNPGLPVLLDIAKDIDLGDPKIAESLAEVRRIAEAAGATVRVGRTQSGTEGTPPKMSD